MYLVVTPAYGRDYKSAKAVKADWEANLDFIDQPSGRYVNKADLPAGTSVQIRYSNLRKVTVIKV